MAHKNGIGATAGRKASTFLATAPDGTILKKKSFFIHTQTALIGAFQHNGEWFASGVTETVQDWGTQIFLNANRVSKPI